VSGLNYVGGSNKKMDSFWRSMQLHIGYLRSLDDSERSRAACFKYLQTNLIYFYGARRDIAEQMEQKAQDLGKRLDPPRLSWKFVWLKTLIGWEFATRAQLFVPHIKWAVVSFWDKILFRIEKREENEGREGKIPSSSAKRQLKGPEEIGFQ
jgi:hypothetical protein